MCENEKQSVLIDMNYCYDNLVSYATCRRNMYKWLLELNVVLFTNFNCFSLC